MINFTFAYVAGLNSPLPAQKSSKDERSITRIVMTWKLAFLLYVKANVLQLRAVNPPSM
jgi:hypothetical protein